MTTWAKVAAAQGSFDRDVENSERETGRVLAGENPNGNEANRLSPNHGSATGGHGGRGHRVSRKVVRDRRRSGETPRRGHNFDHRLRLERNQRHEAASAKAFNGPIETEEERQAKLVQNLLRDVPVRYREEVESELWVMVLEGEPEWRVRVSLHRIVSGIHRQETGDPNTISLDAATETKEKHEAAPGIGELLSDDGRVGAGRRTGGHFRQSYLVDAELVRRLANEGASLRYIATVTGRARNTIAAFLGRRPNVAAMRQPMLVRRCERCGYSPSSHSPNSKARRAGNLAVCDRAVARCACGGWRSAYARLMCGDCRRLVGRYGLAYSPIERARAA